MPRKSKNNNKRTSSSSGTTIASRRHWIYAATTTTTKNDTHQNYLHQRVQRILVRSVPSTYSYFDGAVNDAVAATGGIIEEGKAADNDTVAKDESNEIQQVPHSTKLTYTQIPLPPQQPSDTTSSSDTTTTTTTTQYPSSYSKFTTPIITKDSRHAKFQFSLNYETHVPSKALISYVGTTTSTSTGSVENESGYVLQLPLSMGTVIGYSPPLEEGDDVVVGGEEEEEEEGEFAVERMECGEPLFRVLWDGCTAAVTSDGGGGEGSSDGKKKKNVVGYTEDLTLEELLTCLVTQPATKSSSSSSRSRNTTATDAPDAPADGIIIPPKILTQKALSIHKHVHATTTRKQLSLEEKMENELLPHLVILASLELRKEIAQKIRLEMLLERKKRRAEMGLGGRSRRNANGEEMIVNEDGMAYQYYMRHPNQYLSSFQAPPSLPSDDEESDCEESEDVDNMEVGGGEGGSGEGHVTSGGSKRSSKTKLSKQELVTYNEKVAAACNFAPSKLAERVKLACSMAFEYASRKGLLEAYYVECEQRKERERIEKEKMARDATGVAAKGSAFGLGGIDGTGEVRRSGRARTTVSYYNDDGSRAVDDVVAGEAKKAGEFVVGSLPGENVSGGPSARYLLDVLGMMPKEGAEKNEDKGDDSDEESVPEEEDGGDPFFEPSHCLIIDQLGRKHRYMSPAQIQIAIVRSIDGEIVETPKCLLDEEQAGDDHHYITDIICTTEDKKSDLPQYEPASFARCRFTPHTLMQERVEEDEEDEVDVAAQKQAEREAKAAERARKEERRRVRLAAEQKRNAELERAYRAKKAYELWRFRSIHGDGCTIWPLWSERAQSLLNNLFTMSRVNSVEAIMDVSSSADVQGQAQPAAEAGVNGGASTTQNDEELARSLAAAVDANDNEPLAKRRRTTRRAAGGDEPVFYGGHQSMSRDQLLESLVRLLRQAKPGSSSLMDLKRLVFADDYDMSRGGAVEMRKLRSALGHLIYRLGKIGRLTVDVESDSACMDLLKEGALVKFVSDEPQIKEDGEAVKSEQEADVTMSDSVPLAPVVDEHLKRQLSALEQYMCNLQHTEFSLRAALMKALDKGGKGGETLMQLSTLAIATAADETEGAADAGDWEFYLPKKTEENGGSDAGNANIKWSSSNHAFIGQVIFRPQTSSLRPQGADVDPTEKCHWYRVVSYAASEKADELVGDEKPGNNIDTDARPNVIVERRMRFRAVPIAESDIDAPPMDTGMDSDDEISFMILTEAQVKAGIEAASLHRRISAHTNGNTQSSSLQTHPFRNRAGSRVMLTPVDGQFEVIYGIITGFDLSTGNGIKNKVLILLEDGDNESLKESCAVWASVDAEGTSLTDIHPDNEQKVPSLCSEYKIDMHEYYPGSEAYSVCESVVTYLQNHAKSGPFMEPVDPIALGIFDYPNVVKNPMDVSTLLKNLQEGTYSRIPPKPLHANDDEEEGTDHPVYRMAYGPFYEALMLIFDNAILYNGIDTWIGADASLLKKNVIRKIDQAVSKATWYGQASAKKPSVASGAKKSVYADEDSDVDMYEYESDYEDEEGGGRRKARKAKSQAKRKKKYHAKEDIASKAIEKPFELPEGVSGFGAGGAFPHLKVQTNVGKFSLPQNWSCRHVQEEEEVKDENGGEEASEEEEMLMLMQMQQEEEHGIRRSSRARQAPKSYADEVTDAPATTPTTQSPVVIPGVEYYMIDGDIFQPAQSSGADVDFIPTVCRSRLGAEGVQETIHELFFGKLYRDHSPNAMILGDGLGTYANGSFPPFLGRVIQTDSANNVWEIREQYLIPALRWVLRGLVKSGHLAEVDGSLSDGLLDDAAARTSFGAGIVVPSHEYYYNETFPPFEVLDEKEVLRKRRQEAAVDDDSSSDEEVELSEYEKMRAERVARNAERLKLLGLA